MEEHDVDIFNRRNFDTGFCFNASKELEVEIVEERNGRDVVYHQVVRAQGREFEKSYVPQWTDHDSQTLRGERGGPEAILTLPYEPPRPSWISSSPIGGTGDRGPDDGGSRRCSGHRLPPLRPRELLFVVHSRAGAIAGLWMRCISELCIFTVTCWREASGPCSSQ